MYVIPYPPPPLRVRAGMRFEHGTRTLTHREGRAEKITELSGNPKAHMEALTKDSDTKVGSFMGLED